MTGSDSPLQLASTGAGSGDPVVIIHGFTGSGAAMAPLIGRLDGWRRIAVDLPGHGRSPAPPQPSQYSVEAMAESVARLAATAADEPYHVIGYSMGGRVALALASAHPEVCRTLTLISATAGIADAAERAQRRRADEALADRIDEHGLARFVDGWMALPMWDSLRASLGPMAWQASIDQRLRSDPTGLANSLRAAGTGSMTPLWDRLGALDVPTLVMCGELDAKFVEIGLRMSELLPRSELAVMPGVGHAVHLEAPDLCADTVADFIHP
ncbi:2-succinyl-6-hydroxy-2,4-cyclohexadiene-1-carboxylate synthase [Candidatus Poriferisodalis sp.]|uniref:2-succinyl-6-hydroxy-2, 4-cyclohexadiene-1-carboxylate synthase n=1 Tax=Candidatus Poriferisodalis sp. TaxID=3101277 RepID=UPI003B029A79